MLCLKLDMPPETFFISSLDAQQGEHRRFQHECRPLNTESLLLPSFRHPLTPFLPPSFRYTGLVLWRLFLALDSSRYPVKTYSDLAERIFGRWARHLVTVLQSIQLIVNVGVICLSNAQSLDQMDRQGFCFVANIVIWAVIGILIGQIRTLKNYGWIANLAVWMNVAIMIISVPGEFRFTETKSRASLSLTVS